MDLDGSELVHWDWCIINGVVADQPCLVDQPSKWDVRIAAPFYSPRVRRNEEPAQLMTTDAYMVGWRYVPRDPWYTRGYGFVDWQRTGRC